MQIDSVLKSWNPYFLRISEYRGAYGYLLVPLEISARCACIKKAPKRVQIESAYNLFLLGPSREIPASKHAEAEMWASTDEQYYWSVMYRY